jgi:VanZ family protein
MAIIFAISSISDPPDLPPELGDKGGHALLYFGLSALFVRALAGGWTATVTARCAMAAVFYSTVYGVTDEIHQAFVPPRQVEAADVAADALGAACAALAMWTWHAVRSASREDGGGGVAPKRRARRSAPRRRI